MEHLARALILFGIILVVLGVVLTLAVKFSGKVPWIGQLPGDIIIKRGNFTFYFPLATCLLASLILTLVLSIFRR